jgi:AcrR family transcriptional regulator
VETLTIDPSSDKPSMRERNKAEKRRRIVDAATRLFEEKGFEATTTAEISAAAAVGTGTLYLYVDSKESLLVEVFKERVGQAWREGFELVDPRDPLIDQLLVAFLHVAEYHEQDASLSRAFFKELMFTTGPVADSVDEVMQNFHRSLEALLEEAQAKGALCPEIDPRLLGRNLFAVWYVVMQRHLNRRDGAEVLRSNIEESLRTALHGIAGG